MSGALSMKVGKDFFRDRKSENEEFKYGLKAWKKEEDLENNKDDISNDKNGEIEFFAKSEAAV